MAYHQCMFEYWKFVQYVAVLDDSRWLKRALAWKAGGGRRGRSFDLWDAPLPKFGKWHDIGEWQVAAQLAAIPAGRMFWHLCMCNIFVRSHPLCHKGVAALWHTRAKSKYSTGRHTYLKYILLTKVLGRRMRKQLEACVMFWSACPSPACKRYSWGK